MIRQPRYYILDDDGIPQPVADAMAWAIWFETADRDVGYFERDGYWVSTVFLGLDHNFSGRGPPLIFETMVFDGDDVMGGEPCPIPMERYSTKDNAMIGHERHVRELNRKLDQARDLAQRVTSRNVAASNKDNGESDPQ